MTEAVDTADGQTYGSRHENHLQNVVQTVNLICCQFVYTFLIHFNFIPELICRNVLSQMKMQFFLQSILFLYIQCLTQTTHIKKYILE